MAFNCAYCKRQGHVGINCPRAPMSTPNRPGAVSLDDKLRELHKRECGCDKHDPAAHCDYFQVLRAAARLGKVDGLLEAAEIARNSIGRGSAEESIRARAALLSGEEER